MKIDVTGKGIKLSDAMRAKIDQKLDKFNRYFDDHATVQVIFKEASNHRVCAEITMKIQKHYYRAEAFDSDMMTALEESINIMEGQIRKHKAKMSKRLHDDFKYMHVYFEEAADDGGEDAPEIRRRKSFTLDPMSHEEAALQIELLGHSFLLYLSPETGRVCAVYKRKDGHYGLLEPTY